jgi:hypothetical protein
VTDRATAGRAPWAALLALALVLGLDAWILGLDGSWARFQSPDPNSAAGTRLALAELRAADPERPRLAVVGTSMVIDGFDATLARRLLPRAVVAEMGHPRFEPFVLRALAPELVASRADAVGFIWSELDTHRPLRLEPVPGSSAASLAAVADLLRLTGPRFAVEHRVTLYRMVASSALHAYRYRADLLKAAPPFVQGFEFAERIAPARGDREPFRPVALWDARHNRVAPEAQRRVFDLFPPLMDQWNARMQGGTIQEITRGTHADVQQALLRRNVEVLRRGGVEVVIAEGALHPAAADLYDPRLRAEFRRFGRSLARDLGAHFVSGAAMAPFAESDFYDLVHLNRAGSAKLTRAMVRALRRTGIDWGAQAGPARARSTATSAATPTT